MKRKIIRDPVHNLINIDDEYVLKIIDSRPMQRLRKIRQLGLACLVYPGAEHSRFTHSLGVYHLSTIVMEKLNNDPQLSFKRKKGGKLPFLDSEKLGVSLAALMHDMGHGPFSHLFEHIAKECLGSERKKHENWTIAILQEDPEISKVLKDATDEYGVDISKFIRELIDRTVSADRYYMRDLITSQLDVDRFDYMLRDSLLTGVQYGEQLDFAWILRTLDISSGRFNDDNEKQSFNVLIIDGRRGLSSIESYIMGCYYMYKHVYYHKVICSAERMLQSILMRLVNLIKLGKMQSPHPVFQAFAEKREPSLDEYLSLNDFTILTWIEDWAYQSNTDKILKDLSLRLLSRNIFGGLVQPEDEDEASDITERIKEYLSVKGFDPDYYLLKDNPKRRAYKDVLSIEDGDDHQPIYILNKDNRIVELSGSGSFISEAKKSLKMSEKRWYVPKEDVQQIARHVGVKTL